jgi:hypothetical protein
MATVGAFKQAMKRQRELLESKGYHTAVRVFADEGQYDITGRPDPVPGQGYFVKLSILNNGYSRGRTMSNWGFEIGTAGTRLSIESAQQFQSELIEIVALVEELNKILTSECSDLIPGGVK